MWNGTFFTFGFWGFGWRPFCPPALVSCHILLSTLFIHSCAVLLILMLILILLVKCQCQDFLSTQFCRWRSLYVHSAAGLAYIYKITCTKRFYWSGPTRILSKTEWCWWYILLAKIAITSTFSAFRMYAYTCTKRFNSGCKRVTYMNYGTKMWKKVFWPEVINKLTPLLICQLPIFCQLIHNNIVVHNNIKKLNLVCQFFPSTLVTMRIVSYLIIVTTLTTWGGVPFSSRRTFFHRERERDCF